jgi:hypothetical protein
VWGRHLAVAVDNVHFIVREEAVLGGPCEHVLPNLHALKRKTHLPNLVTRQGRSGLQPSIQVSRAPPSLQAYQASEMSP